MSREIAFHELLLGRTRAGRARPDVTEEVECAGGSGTRVKFRAIGGTAVLGEARNGTTETWKDGDAFVVVYPEGDRGRPRVMARVRGRRRDRRTFPV